MKALHSSEWLGFRRGANLLSLSLVVGLFVGCSTSASNAPRTSADATFGQLFTGSPCNNYGAVGCTQTGAPCNTDWTSYFTTTPDSIMMTAGDDCRTVNTFASCQMVLGDGGVTQISFDFEVAGTCHGNLGTAWLAFWIYSIPWSNQVEVDFVESKYGPAAGGLNTNFAGQGNQVVLFDANSTAPWMGSITANFSGTGSAVEVSVKNTVNGNVGTTTLATNTGYFFVMDTAPGTTATDCTISVSNVQAVGSVASTSLPNNCEGLTISPNP